MIIRLLIGTLLAVLLITVGRPQIGPLPGMAVLPPPGGIVCSPSISTTNIGTSLNSAGSTISLGGVTVPSGSLIAVLVINNTSGVVGTVTDGTNTYSVASQASAGSDGTGIFYAFNASLSNGTITYTKTGNGLGVISAFYATGIAVTAPLDTAVIKSTTSSSTTPSLISGTPVQSGELFVAGIGNSGASPSYTQDTTHNWAAPFNALVNSSIGFMVAGGSQVNAGTGTITFAPTIGGTPASALFTLGFKHC